MADYSRDSGYSVGDRYLDHAGYTPPTTAAAKAEPARTSRIQKKRTTTTTHDFGHGPYTVEDFVDFGKDIADLPPGAHVSVQYYSDREGENLTFTITQ